MQMAKKQKDALQQCEQRPHNRPLVEASNAQEKKVLNFLICGYHCNILKEIKYNYFLFEHLTSKFGCTLSIVEQR